MSGMKRYLEDLCHLLVADRVKLKKMVSMDELVFTADGRDVTVHVGQGRVRLASLALERATGLTARKLVGRHLSAAAVEDFLKHAVGSDVVASLVDMLPA